MIALPAHVKSRLFRMFHPHKAAFRCPICGYRGPFRDHSAPTGIRADARCPSCGSLERHRLQHLVVDTVLRSRVPQQMSMLHIAPEAFLRKRFARLFMHYHTADLCRHDVDFVCDMQALPFTSASYDFVYASHVLEHVKNDRAAIAEIRRILAPGGIAILPVPIVAHQTIEYAEPNPRESMHVRAPGPDYFDRLRSHFGSVEIHSSLEYPFNSQLMLKPVIDGKITEPQPDFVPVCLA